MSDALQVMRPLVFGIEACAAHRTAAPTLEERPLTL
jgi:hypothetical protein